MMPIETHLALLLYDHFSPLLFWICNPKALIQRIFNPPLACSVIRSEILSTEKSRLKSESGSNPWLPLGFGFHNLKNFVDRFFQKRVTLIPTPYTPTLFSGF